MTDITQQEDQAVIHYSKFAFWFSTLKKAHVFEPYLNEVSNPHFGKVHTQLRIQIMATGGLKGKFGKDPAHLFVLPL